LLLAYIVLSLLLQIYFDQNILIIMFIWFDVVGWVTGRILVCKKSAVASP